MKNIDAKVMMRCRVAASRELRAKAGRDEEWAAWMDEWFLPQDAGMSCERLGSGRVSVWGIPTLDLAMNSGANVRRAGMDEKARRGALLSMYGNKAVQNIAVTNGAMNSTGWGVHVTDLVV